MGLVLVEVEAAFADPFLMEMEYDRIPLSFMLSLEMGEFDHFEPLWEFLRGLGVENIDYFRDFLILPAQVVAARDKMPSLWPEIHRTRQFFHVDDDPFWTMRDVLEGCAERGSGLLALCD